MSRRRSINAMVAAASAAVALAGLPAVASADVDPTGCTPNVAYASDIPTFKSVTGRELGAGGTGRGTVPVAGGTPAGSSSANSTKVLNDYADALVAATATNPRVKIQGYDLGKTNTNNEDRHLKFYVVGTPDNINNLDAGRNDQEFWAGVRAGTISEADGKAAVRTRPAFAWVTATPHGNEPAAGEAIARQMYELAARTDCANARRLANLDTFTMLVRNPDGRDTNSRTSPWSFDHNRDFGTQNQIENRKFIPIMNKYPGVFFIDAHQQTSGYFFPPNEDPVHHELSNFTLDFIQKDIGPMLQKAFNDQSSAYQNYNSYDMFTPEYGDSVPSLIMGAAGMTYEKGVDELYGKQVYDHYLAMDKTIDVTSNNKVRLLTDWVDQWEEAKVQGESCELQPNKLVSPLHDTIATQPNIDVCGYFFPPGQHDGDTSRLLKELKSVGVHVYKLDADVSATGVHEYGKADVAKTLPKGTFYIPMGQTQKHWIQAVLGEDPFEAFPYNYDVVTWSYPLQRGLGGSGFLTAQMPSGATMTELDAIDTGSAPASASPVYAFNGDSLQSLALATDLLSEGVTVSRAKDAFDVGTKHFFTGTFLVDGATLATSGADLAALAEDRQTGVYGLTGYPVSRQVLTTPKIGVYVGASVPSYPGSSDAGNHICSNSACETLFGLLEKIHVNWDLVKPVTATELAAGRLVNETFTAFINPGVTIAAGAGATALQTFVNDGGRYVGWNANGISSARNAGMTNVNTNSISGLNTPGTEFSATYDTSNPAAWGADLGGWLYRDSSGNPVIDPATLTLTTPNNVPNATAVVKYGGEYPASAGNPLRAFGFQVNGIGTGKLDGRPAVVDQPYGSGHAILIGFNPYYRGWKDQDERLVLNAATYPTGASLPADAVVTRRDTLTEAQVADAVLPVADPVAKKALATTKVNRAVTPQVNHDKDVKIVVNKAYGKKLKAAVAKARVGQKIRKKIRYVTGKYTVTMVVPNVRTTDDHAREMWVSAIMGQVKKAKLRVTRAQL